MNAGCFKCDKAQWDADGCTCEITGLLVGNAERGCEYRKDTELKPCPFCGGEGEKKKYRFQGKIVYVIMCRCCTSRSPMFLEESKERAIIAWNRRAENDN